MGRELLKMYTTGIKGRQFYQGEMPTVYADDKAKVRTVLSKRLHQSMVVSVENMSKELFEFLVTGILRNMK